MDIPNRLPELQARKLELEIRELERPFFKKASFLSLAVPIFAAVVTGLIGYLGNIELQKLRVQRAQLEETTRQLLTDEQRLSSSFVAGVRDYLAYLSQFKEYEANPSALYTESGLVNVKQKVDAFLASHKKAVLLSRDFADKYEGLLGKETATQMIARSDSATVLMDSVQTAIDEMFRRAIREQRQE